MRTFSLVTVRLGEAMAQYEEDRDVDGVIVVTDDTEEMDEGCEGGDHNLGFIFLATIDDADIVISTCMPCTMDEVKQGTIERITPREQRAPSDDELPPSPNNV